MPVEIDRVEEPEIGRVLRGCGQGCGDRIDREFEVLPGRCHGLGRELAAAELLDGGDHRLLGRLGILIREVYRREVALDQPFDDVRVLLEELGRDDEVGGHEVAVRPEIGLVDEDPAAALLDHARRPRLGDPGAVDVAGDERIQRVRVRLRSDRHVAPAFEVGLVALLEEPGPQGDVLRVAELRRREDGAGQLVGGRDVVAHDEGGSARGRARHDADGLSIRLGKGLIAGFGPM